MYDADRAIVRGRFAQNLSRLAGDLGRAIADVITRLLTGRRV
ncbi:Hypothetical Protein XCAW_01616 [Xanthomonas citri subsp. citri Aw12879]|nr:Hypothetical Protein XCAW_01616 [Xanthomonas citri subsp. citri Aw12879]